MDKLSSNKCGTPSTDHTGLNNSYSSNVKSCSKKKNTHENNITDTPVYEQTVKYIYQLLMTYMDNNMDYDSIDIFDDENKNHYSLEEYIKSICYKNQIEINTLLCSLIYIDRLLLNENYEISINPNNIYNIFSTSLLLAFKNNEDFINNNKYFAISCNIDLKKINDYERYFLSLIDYNLFVKEEEFELYKKSLFKFGVN